MNFTFPAKTKVFTYILMAIGLVALIVGFFTDSAPEGWVNPEEYHHMRWWANLLVNGFFFYGIALGALFFYALQYAAEVAWSAQLKRIFEAMYAFVPIGSIVLIFVFVGASLHWNHIYHWMDEATYSEYVVESTMETDHPEYYMEKEEAQEAGVSVVENPDFDHIIAGKHAYLNNVFFWIRTIIYIAIFWFAAKWFRKKSLEEDEEGGLRIHKLVFKRSALFLVLFAVFSSALAWDWLMSIDTHWFSTMYGWYAFSGMWVTTMIFSVSLVLWLKGKGYLQKVNESHIHDMGKWMFAISLLWCYLWFSQYMLIWYSNIPEEVVYFETRYANYMTPFFLMFAINFAAPFFILMARDAKRNTNYLMFVATLIFVGHFVDVYLMIIPGTMHDHNVFGLFEIGLALGFLGLFIHVVLNALSKAPLVPVNNPYMEESKNHHI
ncbi:quinol:cytochrome C oxidoreductase [Halocola ammonii]